MSKTDLTFITNEEGLHLKDRLAVLFGSSTRLFDCLVGYFYLSGFHLLYPHLENAEKIRGLHGISPETINNTIVPALRNAGFTNVNVYNSVFVTGLR